MMHTKWLLMPQYGKSTTVFKLLQDVRQVLVKHDGFINFAIYDGDPMKASEIWKDEESYERAHQDDEFIKLREQIISLLEPPDHSSS